MHWTGHTHGLCPAFPYVLVYQKLCPLCSIYSFSPLRTSRFCTYFLANMYPSTWYGWSYISHDWSCLVYNSVLFMFHLCSYSVSFKLLRIPKIYNQKRKFTKCSDDIVCTLKLIAIQRAYGWSNTDLCRVLCFFIYLLDFLNIDVLNFDLFYAHNNPIW